MSTTELLVCIVVVAGVTGLVVARVLAEVWMRWVGHQEPVRFDGPPPYLSRSEQ
jgi:hypothetical protein